MNKMKYAPCLCVLAASVLLTGCAPVLIGGAAFTTATVATDRRTTGTIVSDEVLEKRVLHDVLDGMKHKDFHLTVTSYEGKILLTGEVANEDLKRKAQQIAMNSLDVTSVINELAVMEVSSVADRMSDSVLANRVRASIIGTQEASLNQMKVVVDRKIVYLMGVVTPEEARVTTNKVAQISGVRQVVACFTLTTPEEILRRMPRATH